MQMNKNVLEIFEKKQTCLEKMHKMLSKRTTGSYYCHKSNKSPATYIGVTGIQIQIMEQ